MAEQLHWISVSDPPDAFPSAKRAMSDPPGLLAVGGDLSIERLQAAYQQGIFPWYNEGQPVLWWSPDPRAVLWPDRLHISRSLRRRMRSNVFDYSVDQAFGTVIGQCADIRADTGTWITPELRHAFLQLHEIGLAHSFEIWRGDRLAGGLYGMNLGGIFFAESMFSAETDGSKLAMASLCSRCNELGIELIDCQVPSPHLEFMGCESMPRPAFLRLLHQLCTLQTPAGWAKGRRSVGELL